jgi:DUF1365 family protein
MTREPTLFLGHVMHRRLRPAVNAFVYPVFYVQLPLRRLAEARRPMFSLDRFNLLAFHGCDHGERDGRPLLPWIESILRARGLPHEGEIVLQTFPRVFGYVFNPVSFWFCHDAAGALVAVLAEVNNTFGGRHAYLLHNPDRSPLRDGQVFTADKAFHVSPFCTLEGTYRFRFDLQRPVPRVRIDYADGDGDLLLTAISGRPRAWSSGALLGALARMPLMTLGVIARIHWQALRLWLKGVPFYGVNPPPATPASTNVSKPVLGEPTS